MIEIVDALPSHVADLCAHLREREVTGFVKLGQDPMVTILAEIGKSLYSFAVLYNGRVAAIFGAIAMPLSSSAYIWATFADFCESRPITFLRTSRKIFDLLSSKFEVLHGLVLCDFEKSVRWLEWVGCDIMPAQFGLHVFKRRH